jgi:pyruvate,water dikinase
MDGVRWFTDVSLSDTDSVGGKGANLGEMTRAGLPVPPGFVVTSQAYLSALDASGVRAGLAAAIAGMDPDDPASLERTSSLASDLVRSAALPDWLVQQLLDAYRQLSSESVAVRSSGTNEDASDTSFAGMNASFTNVSGASDVLLRITDCWASLYGERVLAYRAEQKITTEPAIAVIVQQMIPSERSGVMFAADPVSGALDRIVVEAVLGQGEAIVSGGVEPDTYLVAKAGPAVRSARAGQQKFKIVRGADGRDEQVTLGEAEGSARVLTDQQVIDIASLGLAVEAHYGCPQDVEWSFADGRVYLVQSRPITTLPSGDAVGAGGPSATASGPTRELLSGLAASTGRASGIVRVLTSPDQQARLQAGEVLVAAMTSPDWLPAMRRASALITDGGGMTCHAAIVSRELGLPCVVGTRKATSAGRRPGRHRRRPSRQGIRRRRHRPDRGRPDHNGNPLVRRGKLRP